MKLQNNIITGKPFTLLELAAVARDFYDNYRSRQLEAGFMMFVATDGYKCMFVPADYVPDSEDTVVFMCDVRQSARAGQNGVTYGSGVHLYRKYGDQPWYINPETKRLTPTLPKWYKKQQLIFFRGQFYRPETPKERELRKRGPVKFKEKYGCESTEDLQETDNKAEENS